MYNIIRVLSVQLMLLTCLQSFDYYCASYFRFSQKPKS